MTPDVTMQIFGEGFMLVVLMVSVLVIPGLVVGLIVSVFQAATPPAIAYHPGHGAHRGSLAAHTAG